MARAIVDTLQLTLAWRSGGAARKAPDLKCYNLCLQGRFHANKRTPDGLRQSVTCFEQAIAADDHSAIAYAGLADSYSLLTEHGFLDPAEATPKARAAAETSAHARSRIGRSARIAGLCTIQLSNGTGPARSRSTGGPSL